MALASLLELVKQRLPYLSSADDTNINIWITQVEYFLQPQTKKLDADVETEGVYSGLQRLLIADLAAYNMLQKKIIENVGGIAGAAPLPPTFVSKAKADVVEAEFTEVKAADGTLLLLDTKSLIIELKVAICSKAAQLRYTIPQICGDYIIDTIPAFKFYQNC